MSAAAANSEYAIDVQGLNKSFGQKHVVDNVSMQVRKGEIFGFLGPNGSGKTTTIRMMCGLLKPDSGSGTCLGYDILRDSADIKRNVGYMTQRFSFWDDMTIRENLDFVARIYEVGNRRNVVRESNEHWGCPLAPANWQESCRADGSSAWRWPHACCTVPSCCCWMSRLQASIPRRDEISGTSCKDWRPAAFPCWSARTTWMRRRAVTSWPTSPTASCWHKARQPRSSPARASPPGRSMAIASRNCRTLFAASPESSRPSPLAMSCT